MKEQIVAHMAKKGLPASIKYIDPSYMIRSVPANAADALFVLSLSLSVCVSLSLALSLAFSLSLCLCLCLSLPLSLSL